jgi:hypothetical protein
MDANRNPKAETNQEVPMTNLSAFCEALMTAVANTVVTSGRKISDYGQASEVLKAEMKAFLFGAEYANERACVLAGTLNERYAIASLVASCLLKIKTEKA